MADATRREFAHPHPVAVDAFPAPQRHARIQSLEADQPPAIALRFLLKQGLAPYEGRLAFQLRHALRRQATAASTERGASTRSQKTPRGCAHHKSQAGLQRRVCGREIVAEVHELLLQPQAEQQRAIARVGQPRAAVRTDVTTRGVERAPQ